MTRPLPLIQGLCVVALLICTAARAQGSGEQRAEAAGHSLVGSPAPRMVLQTIDGQTIDLGRLYGKKAVYLKFWATWCVPCREQMPHFERVYESRGSDLEVIAVNAGFNDSIDDVRTYRQRLGIKMPIIIDDGTLGAALNLRVTPQHVVIGRDGRIQYVGHLASEQLDAALRAARNSPATDISSNGHEAGGATKTLRYQAGDRAPPFAATVSDGTQFDFQPSGQQPQTVALVFLSPWCESYLQTSRAAASARCRETRVQVEALAQEHPQVRWLGIASGLWAAPEDLSKYKTTYAVTIPLTLDASGRLFHTFHVQSVPTVIVINGDGKIEQRIDGSDPQMTARLRKVALPHGPR